MTHAFEAFVGRVPTATQFDWLRGWFAPRGDGGPQLNPHAGLEHMPPPPTPITAAPNSWGYQLQNANATNISTSRFDYVVIDWTSDGETTWSPANVALMRRGGRKLLAYVSIGEAESYRHYWQKNWRPGAPVFILPRNPDWTDNYPVRFEDHAWQDIALGMLRTAQAVGFDGVYLDKVDVYEDRKMGTVGARLMADWVISISKTLKAAKPGFLIFPQNGGELLQWADYRAAIDGMGREDLLYGEDGTDGVHNHVGNIAEGVGQLVTLAREGKPILTVEYSDSVGMRATMLADLKAEQRLVPTLIPLTTRRKLDVLP